MAKEGGERKESRGERWSLDSVAETPFALSRGGLFFAARKMAAAPTRLLHLVRGLEFSPSCSLYIVFVRSFVRSLAHATIPFLSSSYLIAYTHFSLSLSLIIRVSSTPSNRVIYPSSSAIHPFLRISDRQRCWREAKFSISFSLSLISLVFPSRFFFSPKVDPLSCSSSFAPPSLPLCLSLPLPRRFPLRATTTTRCSSEVA